MWKRAIHQSGGGMGGRVGAGVVRRVKRMMGEDVRGEKWGREDGQTGGKTERSGDGQRAIRGEGAARREEWGGDKGRGMRWEERDRCFKEISSQIERTRQGGSDDGRVAAVRGWGEREGKENVWKDGKCLQGEFDPPTINTTPSPSDWRGCLVAVMSTEQDRERTDQLNVTLGERKKKKAWRAP